MAETAVSNDISNPPGRSSGLPTVQVLITVVIAVLLTIAATGGAVFWLIRSGKMPGLSSSAGGIAAKPTIIVVPKSHAVKLEPLLVNLADPGGQSFLRLTVNLRVLDLPLVKGAKKAEKTEEPKKGAIAEDEDEAALRDAALTVLGRETSEELLAPEGKEQLKAKLKIEMTERLPEIKISEMFFTEFLVQH